VVEGAGAEVDFDANVDDPDKFSGPISVWRSDEPRDIVGLQVKEGRVTEIKTENARRVLGERHWSNLKTSMKLSAVLAGIPDLRVVTYSPWPVFADEAALKDSFTGAFYAERDLMGSEYTMIFKFRHGQLYEKEWYENGASRVGH
jgi:hypothetical protein